MTTASHLTSVLGRSEPLGRDAAAWAVALSRRAGEPVPYAFALAVARRHGGPPTLAACASTSTSRSHRSRRFA